MEQFFFIQGALKFKKSGKFSLLMHFAQNIVCASPSEINNNTETICFFFRNAIHHDTLQC